MRKPHKAAILTTFTAVSLFSLSGASAATSPKTNELESLGEANSNTSQASGLTAVVNEAKRDDSGGILSVTWSIHNGGSGNPFLTWFSDRTYIYSGSSFSGITVTSSETEETYHPIMDSEGNCLCSGKTSNNVKNGLSQGEEVTYWSTYSVPEDVKTVTVEIPGFEPIEDIPIS